MKHLVVAVLMLGSWRESAAQSGAFGAPIGDMPVGYRVEWTTDSSRSWDVPDSSGHLRPGPRFVRVHLWYPAAAGTGSSMIFRDYMDPDASPGIPRQLVDAIHGNDFGTPNYSFRGIYGTNEGALEQAMATAVRARSWAAPAPGKFPVVIFSVGQNDFTQDAVSIAEFLASNGFIVETVPHLGTNPRRTLLFVHDPLSYETQLRDLEIALGKALKMKNADEGRILAMGHSYGGIYALLLAMRSHSIRGVIGLDPTYIAQRAGYEYDIRKFPFFDSDIRVPIVTLRRGSGNLDRTLLDSFLHSERLEIVYPDMMHGDFTTVAFLRKGLPSALQLQEEIKVRSPGAAAQGAALAFHQVLVSAERILSSQKLEGAVITEDQVKQDVTYTPAMLAPIHEELFWIYRSRGLQAAKDAVEAARSTAPDRGAFSESKLLTMAREMGYANRPTESLDLFRLASFAFPDSASAQMATADALIDAGLAVEAKLLLERVLQLEPSNEDARRSLAKIVH